MTKFIDNVYNLKKSKKKCKETFGNTENFKKIWNEQCSKYNIKEQPSILPKANRIIVIGDLHGDMQTTLQSLKVARVIDEKNQWIGGDTVIVQVGDQIDRCRYDGINECNKPGVTKFDENSDLMILEFFTDLHNQAQLKGGAVYSLLGNHELMNVNGDMRYVSHKGITGFNNFKSKDITIEDGMDARKYLFSPGNPISNFLACTRQVALIIGSNLFVHAGILPHIAEEYKIQDINQLMSLYLLNKLSDTKDYNKIFNNYESSPLWTRTIGKLGLEAYKSKYQTTAINNEVCDELLNPLTKNYKVQNIYVGHTPLLENGISSVCNKKNWLTDYGGSKAFDPFSTNRVKEIQVLEILNDTEFNIIK